MVSHNPVKFGCHRCCDSGDIIFQVVEELDSECLLKYSITINIRST